MDATIGAADTRRADAGVDPREGREAGSGLPSVDAAGPDGIAAAASARRIVFFSSELGLLPERLAMRWADTRNDEPWQRSFSSDDLPLSPTLQPFSDLRSELTVVEGLANYITLTNDLINADVVGPFSTLTGFLANGPSDDAHPEHLGADSLDVVLSRRHLPSDGVPELVFSAERTFHITSVTQGQTTPALADATAAWQLLPEARGEAACVPRPNETTRPLRSSQQWLDPVLDLVTDALRCDRTRVAMVAMPRPSESELGVPLGVNLHQDCADGVLEGPGRLPFDCFARYNELTAMQVAALARRLARIPAAGGSLLDETLIVWVADEAAPGHRASPWSAVLVGGRALGVRPGRYVHAPQATPVRELFAAEPVPVGPPHNRFLVTLARWFGLDVDFVGAREAKSASSLNRGPFDLTGALPGL
jgi:hypothetical protein